MRFVALSPGALARRLAQRIDALGGARLRIGFDGSTHVGTGELADRVADELRVLNRPTVRVSTEWWWRNAALRLENGRYDVGARLQGWVDVGALRREAFDPLGSGGSGRHLTRFRDAAIERPVRQDYAVAPESAVLLVDGPMLLTHGLLFDEVIRIAVSAGALQRALPQSQQWELAAFTRYREQWQHNAPSGVIVSYDHPSKPAVKGLNLR